MVHAAGFEEPAVSGEDDAPDLVEGATSQERVGDLVEEAAGRSVTEVSAKRKVDTAAEQDAEAGDANSGKAAGHEANDAGSGMAAAAGATARASSRSRASAEEQRFLRLLSTLSPDVQPERVRACSVWDVLAVFGKVLADNAVLSTKTHLEKSAPAKSIDFFLSHSWSQPRRMKVLSIMLVFNFWPAVAASCVAACVGLLLHTSRVLPILQFYQGPHGFVSTLLGLCVFFLCFFGAGDIMHLGCRPLSRPLAFFDKFCINQEDLRAKEEGISALGATISRSERFVVLYSPSYFRRLWTVYEIACFMSLKTLDKLILIPQMMPFQVLGGQLFILAAHGSWKLFTHDAMLRALGITQDADSELPSNAGLLLILLGMLWIACTTYAVIHMMFQDRWAAELSDVERSLKTFRIQDARCSDERDRALVEHGVATLERTVGRWPEDTPDEELLHHFNAKVQNELLLAVKNSLGRQYLPYNMVASMHFVYLYCSLDVLAGDLVAGSPARWAVLNFSMMLDFNFLVAPLAIAVIAQVSARSLHTGRAVMVLKMTIGSFICFWLAGAPITLYYLARHSDTALVACLTYTAVEMVAVYRLYRSQ